MTVDADLEAIARSMVDEPIARRFMEKVEASGDNRVYTADDVLGERLMRLAAVLALEAREPGWVMMNVADEQRVSVLLAFAVVAAKAAPYLWTEEVRQVVGSSIRVPRHVVSPRILPAPSTWHAYETGIGIGGRVELDGRRYVGETADACLIVDVPDGFTVTILGEMVDAESGEKRPIITTVLVPYGKVYPDELPESMRPAAEGALMLLSFLNSPYIPKRQAPASRAARRETARKNGRPVEELVTFILLRRPEPTKRAESKERPVDWKHRWLVSGHLRAQWYPSESAHHLIWVAPYFKGPDDAPLIRHAYKVAR